MHDFIGQAGRRFEMLGRSTFETARGEIATKFPDHLSGNKAALSGHDRVALPLKEALESGVEAECLLSLRRGAKPGQLQVVDANDPSGSQSELHFMKLGDQVFPVQTEAGAWGKKCITLFEPRPAAKWSPDDAAAKGIAGFLGKSHSKTSRITLLRDKGPTTHVQFGGGHVYHDLSYGWALWESVGAALRRGVHAAFVKSSGTDAFGGTKASSSGPAPTYSVQTALTLVLSDSGVADGSGPPLGDDLLDARSWRGRALALTADHGGGGPVHLQVLDKVGGEPAWIEMPWPDGGKGVPARAASMLVSGNRLHVYGGLDAEGEPLRSHWTYDLSAGAKQGWTADGWSVAPPLPEGLAWPVVAAAGEDRLVLGGVAQFYTEGKERVPQHRRTMAAEPLGHGWTWSKRAAAPAEVTGASVVVGRDAVFVGPGQSKDGKVYAYDTGAGGEWVKLPELPDAIGQGQLHLEGDTLFYSGGLTADGGISKKVWALDLSAPDGQWHVRGESDYLAGPARLVESFGRAIALLVAPKGRLTFHAGLGGG